MIADISQFENLMTPHFPVTNAISLAKPPVGAPAGMDSSSRLLTNTLRTMSGNDAMKAIGVVVNLINRDASFRKSGSYRVFKTMFDRLIRSNDPSKI